MSSQHLRLTSLEHRAISIPKPYNVQNELDHVHESLLNSKNDDGTESVASLP